MKKRSISLLCGLLSLFMILLAGCQSVGGIDLNKVLLNGLNIQSYEGEETISVELILNPNAAKAQGQPDLSLFKNAKLSFTNIKGQDPKHFSADAAFSYANGTIPFKLYVTEDELVLQVEGAKKPLVFDRKGPQKQSGIVANPLLNNDPQELAKELAPFIVNKLPNPKSVQVDQVSTKVGNETLSLNKVHAVIKGSEVVDLVKTTITNLLSDEKGLQELTQHVAKLVLGDNYTPEIAELASTQVKESLKEFAASLDQETDNEILNENNYLNVDYFVDESLNVRKKASELYINVPEGDDSELKAIKVSVTADIWNLNKPVTASVIDTKGGSIAFGPETDTKLPHLIKNLDPNSQAYKLLIKDLKATSKDIRLYVSPKGNGYYGSYIDAETGTTLVPVRYVSEQLDAEVKWDGDKQQVTVTDILSDKSIVFTVGSATAEVDGNPVSLDSKAVLKNGSVYVPVRFIAETFGANVSWNNDSRTVSIVRD